LGKSTSGEKKGATKVRESLGVRVEKSGDAGKKSLERQKKSVENHCSVERKRGEKTTKKWAGGGEGVEERSKTLGTVTPAAYNRRLFRAGGEPPVARGRLRDRPTVGRLGRRKRGPKVEDIFKGRKFGLKR